LPTLVRRRATPSGRAPSTRRAPATPLPTTAPAADGADTPIGVGVADRDRRDRRGQRSRKARHGGRPSQADAALLGERILDVATDLFLTEGYGATTIEAVAARAGISKRTFYHRFEHKAALFAAVVHRIIEQLRPPPGVPLLEGTTLHDVLRRFAGLILRGALTRRAIALYRLVTGESARFPNLLRAVYQEGWSQQAAALIGDLLARELRDSRLTSELRTFAAEQFVDMVITLPQRRAAGLGDPMTAKELDAWADGVVRLFLNGCKGLAAASQRSKTQSRST
jgi:TetR/AcrR family transcriptional regulator, mexJK operon transcriptional repressor